MTPHRPKFDFVPVEARKSVRYGDGGVVFLKGDAGDKAYIVKSGKVEIREGGRALESIRTGGLFGEMALIDRKPRSASAVAVGPTELHVIDAETFDRLVRELPDFAMGVMRLMADRLRATNAAAEPVRRSA